MANTVSCDTPNKKRRPIVRLGLFLISHSFIASVVCCSAGILSLLLLPVLAKNTYISENALMPGSAKYMLTNQDVVDSLKLREELDYLNSKANNQDTLGIHSRRLIGQHISNLGAEVSHHKFQAQLNQFDPLQFFASPDSVIVEENTNCSRYGGSMVGIIRAPRGDGKEAIVLVSPYNFASSEGETLSLSIAFSVFSLLTRVTWLAKDIIWLVADSQYGEYPPVTAWLRDYHSPVFSGHNMLEANTCNKTNIREFKQDGIQQEEAADDFLRAGTLAAALVIKVSNSKPFQDTVGMYAEASNGQMPNLDLINIVNYLARLQGMHVKVERLWSLPGSKLLKYLGEAFELLGGVAKSINPRWKFGVPANDYVEEAATLASSLYYQALGIPTGSHGAFRDFQVDAITLEISPGVSSRNKGGHSQFFMKGGRLIEDIVRSVNNLLEKFHQSFFLYLLTSPNKFVSVGVYMIPFALLVAPLPLVAASLYAEANNLNLNTESGKSDDELVIINFKAWKWLNAARKVCMVHLWGAVVSLLPYFITQVPECSPTVSFGIWILLSVVFLYVILGTGNRGEWGLLKSVTISSVFISLSLMSIINYATAELGALLLVPTCLFAHPLKPDIKSGELKYILRVVCNLVLNFLSFPPVIFFVVKGGVSDVGEFWAWAESLWAWNSATYLYIGMIHLPCWVLCIHVLLHSC